MRSNPKQSNKDKTRVHFGSTIVLRGKHHANAGYALGRNPVYLDSGASMTMFQERREAGSSTYRSGSKNTVQPLARDNHAKCLGKGPVSIGKLSLPKFSARTKTKQHSPISRTEFDQGKVVLFMDKKGVVLNLDGFTVDESNVLTVLNRQKDTGLYAFDHHINDCNDTMMQHTGMRAQKVPNEINLWHNRLIHTNIKVLKKLKEHSKKFPLLKGNLQACHPCELGKATNEPFDSHFEIAEYTGEIVHSNLAGPVPKIMEGIEYFCAFTYQKSRFAHVIRLEKKRDAVDAFEYYKDTSRVKKYFPKGSERLQSDGGGEYENVEVQEHSPTTPDIPQHNPYSERVNHTILEPVCVLLEQAGLNAKYWEYALDHVAYVKNRVPHSGIG